ncbi:MAG: hypothetical protein LQ346_002074 [Caloplaca aetnensis]|nr:MAG: hypothetical protein LQ346_002074 [Caloplaca aetnensis]
MSTEPPHLPSSGAGVDDSMSRPRQRRTSSTVGDNLRGDTGASALSTLEPTPTFPTPPISPVSLMEDLLGLLVAYHNQNLQAQEVEVRDEPGERPQDAPRRRPRRRRDLGWGGWFRRWQELSFRHTWVNPLIVMLVVLASFAAYPKPSNPLYPAIFLSYPLDPSDPLIPADVRADPAAPVHYGKGRRDFAFVAFYIVVLSFTREFIMQRALRPLARRCKFSRSKQNRFMEQAYTAIYFAIFGPYGLWVMYRSPVWYFDTVGMYETFPNRTHEALFKAYYLLQASYWAQQSIVLCLVLEKPRKDFKELVAHHIVTLALVWLSYRFHFTYMGLAVYVTHDVSDFFLATSKMFSYLDLNIVAPYFSVFIAVWVYLRHYINIVILHSIMTTFASVGPFELNWDTEQYKCWIAQYITFALLAALQAINIFWLWFIVRIAARVLRGGDKKDDRSDDEDEEEDEKDVAEKKRLQEREQWEKDKAQRREMDGTVPNGTLKETEVSMETSTRDGEVRKRA